jgi:hypothetical protein
MFESTKVSNIFRQQLCKSEAINQDIMISLVKPKKKQIKADKQTG